MLGALAALAMIVSAPGFCLQGAHMRVAPQMRLAPLAITMDGKGGGGKGFGKVDLNAAAEERGRKLLDELRAASNNDIGSDIDGLDKEESLVPSTGEGEPSPVLGLAGFLILAGVISLFVGGPLWSGNGFNDDGSQPDNTPSGLAPDSPAFGFVPKAVESMPPEPDNAPTWAD